LSLPTKRQSTANCGKQPQLRLPGIEHRKAVKLGHSVGMSEASRRLGIPDSSLFNWVRLERKGKLGTSVGVSATPRSAKELEAEVDRLRHELASAKVDNEILKKAAAYFAKESR
jgi:transposase